MSRLIAPQTNFLISSCLNMSQATGVPAPFLLCHALLLATALVGGKACYRRNSQQAPQIIASPASVLSSDATCPAWFNAALGRTIERQKAVSAGAEDRFNLAPLTARVRRAKRLVKMYAPIRELMPDPLLFMMEANNLLLTPATFRFLHDLRCESAARPPVEFNAFGAHLIALAIGDDCYGKLLAGLDKAGSLLRQAKDREATTRVTIHGWSGPIRIRNLMRQASPEDLSAFGWLLEFPEASPPPYYPDHLPGGYLLFFDRMFEARLHAPKTFLPSQEIIELLDAAVEGQASRSRISPHPVSVANPFPMLPWQVATVLWLNERSHKNPDPQNSLPIAIRASRLAQFIHENHLHTLGRMFPTIDGSTDPVNAVIIDKLAVKPLHLRNLNRKFHHSQTDYLRDRLEILRRAGIVREEEDGKWYSPSFSGVGFEDLVSNLSAKEGDAREE